MQVFGLVVLDEELLELVGLAVQLVGAVLDEELLELVGLAVQLVGAAIAHMILGASWQGDIQELSPFEFCTLHACRNIGSLRPVGSTF